MNASSFRLHSSKYIWEATFQPLATGDFHSNQVNIECYQNSRRKNPIIVIGIFPDSFTIGNGNTNLRDVNGKIASLSS